MKKVKVSNVRDRVRKVKSLMTSTGNLIGSVWFITRGTGELKKMAFRRNVSQPTYEKKPTGKRFAYKRAMDSEKNLLTVFSVNSLRYDKKGKLNGRGGWRSVPLDAVVRLKVGGQIYKFV